MELDKDVAEFATIIGKLADLLNENAQNRWGEQLRRCERLLIDSDFEGVRRFLGLFGGMGSLNDVIIADPLDNAEMISLLQSAYTAALQFARDADLTT